MRSSSGGDVWPLPDFDVCGLSICNAVAICCYVYLCLHRCEGCGNREAYGALGERGCMFMLLECLVEL